ncbi:gap junction delta-3 protein [Suncus etruscus]|uniref:gap junction delta-3 protein n=1 Tax=Suncus etruscus TaxID=109475 RepID=UPI00210FACE8|nr:gap junction delta-3 protein [Suncus etruscus]
MGEWAFLGSLLDAVQLQSPLVGRLWLVVMLIFRILVLATVGGAVFEDEQEEFVCNTLQPGCRQTCYDRAFPVSHYRFWLFHILLLSAPPVLFAIYSMHRASKGPAGSGAEAQARSQALQAHEPRDPQGGPGARRCYLLSVLLRLLAELAFLAGQTLLYGFRVAPHFACAGPPCPHTVDCFVSRPTEKTVFVLFYFAVGLLSALLSLAELAHLLCKRRPAAAARHDNRRNRAREQAQAHKLLPPPPPPSPAQATPTPCTSPARGRGHAPDAPPAYAHRPPSARSDPGPGACKVALQGVGRPDLAV